MTTHILDTIDPAVLGERLMEARKARGLTQEAVASRLGVARTTITAMEKGERRPRAAELITLAQLFGRSVGDLVRSEPPLRSPDFLVQFRESRSGAESPERQRDIQRFEQLCRWYAELSRLSGSPRPVPDEYRLEGRDPAQAALILASAERNRLGLGDGPIANLWEVLESDVGLWIFGFPMEDRSISGMFLFTAEYGGCVAVNANHPFERQNWTLCHEYAHFLTDRFKPDIQVLQWSKRRRGREKLADEFALHFLMPATGLSRRFSEMQQQAGGLFTAAELLQLSHLYQVSAEAMTLRLEGLELLERGTWDVLRERGFRPNEARRLLGIEVEPTGSVRLPVRYVSLAVQAFEQGELSEGELAHRLLASRLNARQQVLDLTTKTIPSGPGEWAQIRFDLATPLASTGS